MSAALAASRPPRAAPTIALSVEETLGIVRGHEAAGRLAQADAMLGRVLAAAPGHADALHLQGIVAYKAGRHAEALGHMQQAIARGIDTPLYYRNIAELYRSLGRLAEAEAAARRGMALNPADPIALLNLGIVLSDLRRSGEAARLFQQAIALDPLQAGAHFGLAEALLMQGEFARGWEEYEWRFRLPEGRKQLPNFTAPQWQGEDLKGGTLLLFADQGFGDAIQFGRYLPWVAARCPRVVLACSATLRPLLAQMQPGIRSLADWREAGEYAAWKPLSGLPRLAGTRVDSVPDYPAKLRAEPVLVARWRARLDGLAPRGMRRVGLVWAGRPTHKNDRRRSTTLDALAPLFDAPGTAFVVLQKGPAQRQVGRYRGPAPLIHLSTEIETFADTMAAIEALDLVLTVDTSVAHLAGAMGRPVWVMLPWSAEWRWLEQRQDSPWYPSMRLFRQPTGGDWSSVAISVAHRLASTAW
jgi:hypothetical protein